MAGKLMHMAYIMWLEEKLRKNQINPIPSPIPTPTPVPPEPEPIVLSANTLRFRFSLLETDPSNIECDGIWTKVTGSDYNDWDWTCGDTDWKGKLSYVFNDDITDPEVHLIATGDLSSVTTVTRLFCYCNNLKSVCNLELPNVMSMEETFQAAGLCLVGKITAPQCNNFAYTFAECDITEIPEIIMDYNIKNIYSMFQYCQYLSGSGVAFLDKFTNPDVYYESIFNHCPKLSDIDELKEKYPDAV